MKGIFKYICKANTELFDFCKKKNIENKKDYNHEGTCVSWFLQDKECLVLEYVFKYCCDNGYIENDICALCNDGIMLQKDLYNPNLLTELNSYILEQTGFNLNFIEKPLDEGYGENIDAHLVFNLWEQPITDSEYALYFKLLYHHNFIVNHQIPYYYNGVYWEKEEDRRRCVNINNKVVKEFTKYIISRTYAVRKKIVIELNDYQENVKFGNVPQDMYDIVTKKYRACIPAKPITDTRDIITYHLEEQKKAIDKYIISVERYLGNVSSRDKLVKDICRVITCDWIEFDKNAHLLAFNNGVYDLNKDAWVKSCYTQYISITTGWEWSYTYNSKYVERVNEILTQIFPNPDVRKHYLTVLSTGLYGETICKFFIAKGVGGNGKGLVTELMTTAVGGYGYKLPSAIMSREIKSGANPEIANMNNKRFVYVQEPTNSKISTAAVKELTGGASLNCRGLYSADTETRLKLTLLMECNELPKLDESGDAMARRLDVTPFDARFMNINRYEELSEDEIATGLYHIEDTTLMDANFKNIHKQAFMVILMEHFKDFRNNSYTVIAPKIVVNEAKEYLKYSDDIYGWFMDTFKKDDSNVISFKQIYNAFCSNEYYNNLSKAEKRKYNQAYLKKAIQENMFLKNYFKGKGRMFDGKRVSADSVVGFAFIDRFGSDDDDDDSFVSTEVL